MSHNLQTQRMRQRIDHDFKYMGEKARRRSITCEHNNRRNFGLESLLGRVAMKKLRDVQEGLQ